MLPPGEIDEKLVEMNIIRSTLESPDTTLEQALDLIRRIPELLIPKMVHDRPGLRIVGGTSQAAYAVASATLAKLVLTSDSDEIRITAIHAIAEDDLLIVQNFGILAMLLEDEDLGAEARTALQILAESEWQAGGIAFGACQTQADELLDLHPERT